MRHRRRELPLNAEINVVNLIDVMLLLLGLVVSVDRSGAIYVDETKMTLSEFRASFRALAGNRARAGVYLRGDAGVPYGVVTQVLAVMRAAGVGDVGLVTDPEPAP